jgi:hypothetical protein
MIKYKFHVYSILYISIPIAYNYILYINYYIYSASKFNIFNVDDLSAFSGNLYTFFLYIHTVSLV